MIARPESQVGVLSPLQTAAHPPNTDDLANISASVDALINEVVVMILMVDRELEFLTYLTRMHRLLRLRF